VRHLKKILSTNRIPFPTALHYERIDEHLLNVYYVVKGAVSVISNYIPCKEGHFRFTRAPLKPLTGQG